MSLMNTTSREVFRNWAARAHSGAFPSRSAACRSTPTDRRTRPTGTELTQCSANSSLVTPGCRLDNITLGRTGLTIKIEPKSKLLAQSRWGQIAHCLQLNSRHSDSFLVPTRKSSSYGDKHLCCLSLLHRHHKLGLYLQASLAFPIQS